MAQRWGLTLPLPGITLADHEELVKRAEAAGYTDLWTGETNGPDGFTPLALSAAWTERARLGTGIVGVFQRGPALLAQEAAALADASDGRFVLGIGSSSDRIVEGWNGIPFERPLSKVRETLDFLDAALAGERTATGFKLESAPGAAGADRAGGAARQDARAGGGAGRRRLHQLPAAGRAAEGDRPAGRARRRASSCSAASSASPASASRSSRWPASCSPPTSPSRSTPPSTAGSATASRSTPMVAAWEAGDRQARRGGGALGADRGDVHLRHARSR